MLVRGFGLNWEPDKLEPGILGLIHFDENIFKFTVFINDYDKWC